jgi:hypothetical protein
MERRASAHRATGSPRLTGMSVPRIGQAIATVAAMPSAASASQSTAIVFTKGSGTLVTTCNGAACEHNALNSTADFASRALFRDNDENRQSAPQQEKTERRVRDSSGKLIRCNRPEAKSGVPVLLVGSRKAARWVHGSQDDQRQPRHSNQSKHDPRESIHPLILVTYSSFVQLQLKRHHENGYHASASQIGRVTRLAFIAQGPGRQRHRLGDRGHLAASLRFGPAEYT